MLTLHDRPSQLCDGITRRDMLRVGSLAMTGLSLPALLRARETNPDDSASSSPLFGRAKNVIFLYLAGGPPQHETFDPKPNAPVGIRGPFNPIQTNIPGLQFCELLPRTAGLADELAVVRSMATDDNTHSSSSAWVLSGHKYRGANPRTIAPTDWPYFGSIVKMQRPSDVLPALSSVWIPDLMRLNENVTPAGQSGGFLGPQWDPERFVGDPSDPAYEIESLRQTDVTTLQLDRRRALLAQVESRFAEIARADGLRNYDLFQQQAFDLLTTGRAREAFAIDKEPDKLRDRYGRNRWGQCVLLARRLVEAGVRLVHVQWPREPGDNAVDNPLWDTHAQNADRLEDVLCPMFDVGFSALIEDLQQRGLLEETLVVAIGEFGRTPKINSKGGRDHWGPVFSFVMAGAGISGGQVFGSSDKNGAYPQDDRVEPGDLTATIFHLLGMDHRGTFPDRQGRPHPLTAGEPIYKLLGTEPATSDRISSTGDVARVPPYDPSRLLTNTDFSGDDVLRGLDAPSRPKGWRVPRILNATDDQFGVRLLMGRESGSSPQTQHAAIGFNLASGNSQLQFAQGTKAFLAQEVRSPFAGHYRFRVRLRGAASSQRFYEAVFQKHFTCRMAFFQFDSMEKKADARHDLASITVSPQFAHPESPEWQTFELTRTFQNPNAGGNFSFGSGMGVAIEVEKTSPGVLELDGEMSGSASICVADVELEFNGKQVNPDVKV